MKKALIILLMVVPLANCTRKASIQQMPPVVSNTTIREKLTPVALAPDSSYIQMLLSCDSLNQVYLKEITETKGQSVVTSFSLKDNKLQYKAKFIHDTVYIAGKDSISIIEIPVAVSTPVYINQLKWYQKTLIWGGLIALLYLMYLVLNFIARLRNGSR